PGATGPTVAATETGPRRAFGPGTCKIPRVTRWPWLVPALVLALTLATVSCSDADRSETTATTVRADGERTSPTTSGATAGTGPDAAEEGGGERQPQVVLGGDSVMGNLVPAVDAAIGDQAGIEYL